MVQGVHPSKFEEQKQEKPTFIKQNLTMGFTIIRQHSHRVSEIKDPFIFRIIKLLSPIIFQLS